MDANRTNIDQGERLNRLRRFVQLAPHDPEVHLVLARELMDHSLREEAAAELHTVISLSPNHLEARKLLEQVAGSASSPRH